MRDFDDPNYPRPVRITPILLVVVAMTMIGASFGVLIADGDALPLLKKNFAAQLASVRSFLLTGAGTANEKKEAVNVIPIGLSSIVAIHYSSEPDSTHMTFDLQETDLIRTGKLHSPDRIYFDLQDHRRERGSSRRLKTQKAISIAGNLLTRVRISQRKQGAMRVVLDLKRSCDFTYQTLLGSPSHLMVEIRPRLASAPVSE